MFNPAVYDFLPVSDAVKKFYTLGLEKNIALHPETPENKLLWEAINNQTDTYKQFNGKWQILITKIRAEISLPLTITTNPQLPCFSAFLQLEENKYADLTRKKGIHFFISLLGEFYSIIGEDSSAIEFEPGQYHHVTNSLTVSPVKEYAGCFNLIYTAIISFFENYRLIPFDVLLTKMDSVYSPWFSDKMNLFETLYNNRLNIKCPNINGDTGFGFENWYRKDYDPEENSGWTLIHPDNK
jgi:hypothetical protein